MPRDNAFVSYEDYPDDDQILFRLRCIAFMVLGISLLIGRTVLDLGLWSIVTGLICIGITGPFVSVLLGDHVAEPADRLVYGFGRALPGISLGLVAYIARSSPEHNEIRTFWGFVIIFSAVWVAIFLGGSILRYLWLRRSGYGAVWHEDEEGSGSGWYERPRWSSYEWASFIVAIISGGGSIAAVVVKLVK